MTLKQRLKGEKWDGELRHFLFFVWATLLFSCPVLGRMIKGITPPQFFFFSMLCFVLINNAPLNLWCVWSCRQPHSGGGGWGNLAVLIRFSRDTFVVVAMSRTSTSGKTAWRWTGPRNIGCIDRNLPEIGAQQFFTCMWSCLLETGVWNKINIFKKGQ